MQQIATSLMFVGDKSGKAEEAVNLYVSVFEDAKVLDVERFKDSDPVSGIKLARLQIAGREFLAMDGGDAHQFTFTPAVSLVVSFDDAAQLDAAWATLVDGGAELMPLGEYDFSPKFGWLNDRYGVSWQLRLA